MTQIKSILSIVILAMLLPSCAKLTPASFWKSFQKKLIVKYESDQGPWGGHREIHWKATGTKTFEIQNVLDFAKKNGWVLAENLPFKLDPSHYENENDAYLHEILRNTIYRKWASEDVSTIYVFRTGWVCVKPGDDSIYTGKTGFIALSRDKKTLLLYHTWGDGYEKVLP